MEGARDQGNLTMASVPKDASIPPGIDGRERIKIEFYKTYDVMTGIRIAATLGGFFSMMILLVLYKNYCKPSKTLSEEQLNAAVTAAVEEEDRALKAALEATSFYSSLSKQRESATNESSAMLSPRFSSVGGGCSHLAPPMRFSYLQQRGKSLPGSALRFATEEPRGKDPEATGGDEEEAECQLPEYFAGGNYLSVPPDRRLSSITCSSTDTSYLERRGSAFEMGLPAGPGFVRGDADKQKLHEEGPWDFYYPIDIQVIQPTPEISPAGSAETLYEKPHTTSGLQVPGFHDRLQRLSTDSSEIGLAPLASISSLASFGSNTLTLQRAEQNETTPPDSVGSDSVFMDEEMDTEDEVEEFSTDSEFNYDGFDDDYSFCERPVSRCRRRSLQFASFDSCDGSVARDTLSEDKPKRPAPEAAAASRGKRVLSKTNSEPRPRVPKHLPPWIDKGRSGYVPKRQLSVPASRKKTKDGRRTSELQAKPPGSSSDSNTPTSNVIESGAPQTPPQGLLHKDLPLHKSLQKQEDKRKRFQKQKTVNEEWSEDAGNRTLPTRERPSLAPPQGATLALPQVNVDMGSCERLNILPGREDGGQELLVPGTSPRNRVPYEPASGQAPRRPD